MSARANYFKIGLFVIVATAMGIVAIVVLGAGTLFRETIIAETYFDESVQGLEVGGAVRYRGVRVGKVREISFVHNYYPLESELSKEAAEGDGGRRRYVLARFSLYPDIFRGPYFSDFEQILRKEIERGLRCRLGSQGLTGALYIEIDYLDPTEFPPLPITWNPETGVFRLPSATSTITRWSEAVDNIMTQIEQVLERLEALSIEPIVKDLLELIHTVRDEIHDAQLGTVSADFLKLLASLQEASIEFNGACADLRELVHSPEITSILADTAGTISGARSTFETTDQIVTDAQTKIVDLMDGLLDATQKIRDASDTINQMFEGNDLPEAAEHLNAFLERLNNVAALEQQNVETILENLRQLSEDLREFGRTASENPSQVIFGGPPPRQHPEDR
jgi:phospholipid/cholesterol/gamma-HCH transport system substrate-binding protein